MSLNPITLLMLAEEKKAGRTPIYPHTAPRWLEPTDWRGWPVLAIADGELHIVAIYAARPGALTRLIAGARSAGLSPVIVAPMGDMHAILARWGWKQRITGEGWDAREEWRPAHDAGFRAFLKIRHGSIANTLLDRPHVAPARPVARPFAPTVKKPGDLEMHSRGFRRVA